MPFNILSVVSADSPEHRLIPEPGNEPDSIWFEDADGEDVTTFPVTELAVLELLGGRPPVYVVHFRKLHANVFVTEQRLAVACSKYDKGNRYIPVGGPAAGAMALGAMAVSGARARRRRAGKMLVGHVGYDHLLTVGFRQAAGVHAGKLRVGMVDPTVKGRGVMLDITFDRKLDVAELAQLVVQHATECKLDHGKLSADEQEFIEAQDWRSPPTDHSFAAFFFADVPKQLAVAFQLAK